MQIVDFNSIINPFLLYLQNYDRFCRDGCAKEIVAEPPRCKRRRFNCIGIIKSVMRIQFPGCQYPAGKPFNILTPEINDKLRILTGVDIYKGYQDHPVFVY